MEGIVNTTGISEAGTVVLEMEVEDKVYLRMDLAHVEGINLPVPPAFSFFFCVACNFRSKNLMPWRIGDYCRQLMEEEDGEGRVRSIICYRWTFSVLGLWTT